MITDEDFLKAWDRISRTRDGELIYLDLQKVLCGILETSESGALQRNEGRRSLARDLMAKMAGGIETSAGRSSTDKADRAVVFTVRQPVNTGQAGRGARRRVQDDTIVEGWNDQTGGAGQTN